MPRLCGVTIRSSCLDWYIRGLNLAYWYTLGEEEWLLSVRSLDGSKKATTAIDAENVERLGANDELSFR